jgi:biopolymer transport protein ExbD
MSFGGGLDDDDDVVNEINMTPLVDVMLVLLIIFIITVPVLTHSVKVDLPRAQNALNEVKPETVSISVTSDGVTHWNEDAVDKAALEQRLLAAAAQTPQPEIHIRGDRTVDYEHVVAVMAAAQRAGVHKLGFVTDPGQ